jgi:hypothetical protein
MKETLAQDAMLAYPQFDKPFVGHTDAENTK